MSKRLSAIKIWWRMEHFIPAEKHFKPIEWPEETAFYQKQKSCATLMSKKETLHLFAPFLLSRPSVRAEFLLYFELIHFFFELFS